MADNSEEAKARAEARFNTATKKQQDLDDALAQERAKHQAVLDRTAKLKAERLAKEAADKAAAEQTPKLKPKRQRSRADAARYWA